MLPPLPGLLPGAESVILSCARAAHAGVAACRAACRVPRLRQGSVPRGALSRERSPASDILIGSFHASANAAECATASPTHHCALLPLCLTLRCWICLRGCSKGCGRCRCFVEASPATRECGPPPTPWATHPCHQSLYRAGAASPHPSTSLGQTTVQFSIVHTQPCVQRAPASKRASCDASPAQRWRRRA